MSSRKRKPLYDLVDIRSLPEISSLDPDSLKEFTKEELLSYLVHFDIEPAETKPNMKRQMRALIMALRSGEKNPAAVVPSGRKFARSESNDEKNYLKQYINNANNSFNAPLTNTQVSNGSEVQMDSYFCVHCKIRKANKDCKYHRCKPCCITLSQDCSVHSRNQNFVTTSRSVSLISAPSLIPQQQQSQQQQPTFSSISSPSPSISVQNATNITNTQPSQGQYVPPVFKELENEFDEKYQHKVKVCPRCQHEILNIGSNFLIHLRQCDLNLFLQYIKQNKEKEDHTSNQSAENSLEVARRRALQRFKRNMECMKEIFSSTSVDTIANNIKSLSEERHLLSTHLLQQLQHWKEEYNKFLSHSSAGVESSQNLTSKNDIQTLNSSQYSISRSNGCYLLEKPPPEVKTLSKSNNLESERRILLLK